MSDSPATEEEVWGDPSQLRFIRNMANCTPPGEVFPLRREFILWMLDRIEQPPEPPEQQALNAARYERLRLDGVITAFQQANGDGELIHAAELDAMVDRQIALDPPQCSPTKVAE